MFNRRGQLGPENPLDVQMRGSSVLIEAVNVTTSAQALSTLLGSVKPGRSAIELQNVGAGTVYVGPATVSASTGRKIAVDGDWSIPLSDASDVYLLGDAAATVIVTQA